MANDDCKTCSCCKESKPHTEFHKNSKVSSGLCSRCKLCAIFHSKRSRENDPSYKEKKKLYHLAHRDEALKARRDYRAKNIDAVRAHDKERGKLRTKEILHSAYVRSSDRVKKNAAKWKANNKDKNKEIQRQWSLRNKDYCNAKGAQRYAMEKSAIPSWANSKRIVEIYREAKEKETSTGERWHVDHIVPILGKTVCGLHVENNLQVIPAAVNQSKGNRYWPDMP